MMFTIISYITAIFLFGLGLSLFVDPESGLKILSHHSLGLTSSFGGRYLGLALLFAIFAWLNELKALTVLYGVGGFLGLLDGVIYLGVTEANSWPHFAIGVAGLVVAALCFKGLNKKELAA